MASESELRPRLPHSCPCNLNRHGARQRCQPAAAVQRPSPSDVTGGEHDSEAALKLIILAVQPLQSTVPTAGQALPLAGEPGPGDSARRRESITIHWQLISGHWPGQSRWRLGTRARPRARVRIVLGTVGRGATPATRRRASPRRRIRIQPAGNCLH